MIECKYDPWGENKPDSIYPPIDVKGGLFRRMVQTRAPLLPQVPCELVGGCMGKHKATNNTKALAPPNMKVQKGPFQEESSLSTGVCALPC